MSASADDIPRPAQSDLRNSSSLLYLYERWSLPRPGAEDIRQVVSDNPIRPGTPVEVDQETGGYRLPTGMRVPEGHVIGDPVYAAMGHHSASDRAEVQRRYARQDVNPEPGSMGDEPRDSDYINRWVVAMRLVDTATLQQLETILVKHGLQQGTEEWLHAIVDIIHLFLGTGSSVPAPEPAPCDEHGRLLRPIDLS